jgi:uncharacterized protein
MTGVIDIMNYAPLVAPGLSGPEYQFEEFQTMVRTTLRPLLRDRVVTTQWGREVDVDHPPTEPDPSLHIEGALAELDRTGCEAAVLACVKMWSYRSHHRLIMDMPEEVVAEAVQKGGGRFIGAAGYNPFRIDESLRRIETFVRDHGFRYVYFHPMTFGLAPDDRRCYPSTPSALSWASRSACRSVIPPNRCPATLAVRCSSTMLPSTSPI